MQRAGRAQAVVVISPIRRWWAWWLRLTWPPADRNPLLKRPLVKLAFIHVAHWSLLDRIPLPGGGRLRLPHPYIVFHSNYNDDLAAYIDAFALIVPWRMRGMWSGIYGFPGPRIVDRFLEFVMSHAVESQHYYCAYPDGSARMIAQALELCEDHDRLRDLAPTLTDDQFAEAFNRFVADNQERL
jgi:hypothetical protein